MKKLLVTTAVALMLTLGGCGGADDVSDDPTTDLTSSASTSQETTESTPTTSEPTEDSPSVPEAGGPYCAALEGAKTNLSAIDFTKIDEQTYQKLVTELAKVTAAAPSDVKDDWEALTGALDDLHRLLGTAGISFDDLQQLSAGQLPPGVDAEQLQKIAPKLQSISTDGRIQQASKAIEASAKSECGVNLSN